MNFQEIRKYYEYPVIDCCNLQGVEFRAENTLEPGGDAIHKFCLARLQFGEMAEQTLYCGLLSNKRAVFVVEYYGPKGIGPADAQEFMECVICKFHELKGVVSVNGPDFTALDNRPYFFARASFGLIIPAELSGTTGGEGDGDEGDDGTDGGGTIGPVTTADVDLTNPTAAPWSEVDTTVITPPTEALETQEDANQYFAQAIDELDEALEDHKDYTDIKDLDELV